MFINVEGYGVFNADHIITVQFIQAGPDRCGVVIVTSKPDMRDNGRIELMKEKPEAEAVALKEKIERLLMETASGARRYEKLFGTIIDIRSVMGITAVESTIDGMTTISVVNDNGASIPVKYTWSESQYAAAMEEIEQRFNVEVTVEQVSANNEAALIKVA